MKNLTKIMASVLLLASAGQALSKNDLLLTNNNTSLNLLSLDVVGVENKLSIAQEHHVGGSANRIDLSIVGDLNGGPIGSQFTGRALETGLAPGSISQSGFDNLMSIRVVGSGNLFAFHQNGSGNRLDVQMQGNGNQTAVSQVGFNNTSNVYQVGNANIVSISQVSW